jgi:hypothetical protein
LSIVPRRDPPSGFQPASPRLDRYAATPRNPGAGTADISPSRVAAPRSGSAGADVSPSRTAASRVPYGNLAHDSGSAVSRPRGSNSVGTRYAVPRNSYVTTNHYPEQAHHYHSYYVAPVHYLYHTHFYYYPQYLYPYGYGAFGLGYFYYDPYAWAPVATMGYDGNAYGYGYGNPSGGLRLQVRPGDAEVYVDGYYAGMVDEFDGTYQSLQLEEGEYHIEIIAAGYETVAFDVRIQPGRTINYRGDMFPQQRP